MVLVRLEYNGKTEVVPIARVPCRGEELILYASDILETGTYYVVKHVIYVIKATMISTAVYAAEVIVERASSF